MKTTPIKISYLNEVQSVKEIQTDAFLLLTYNDNNLKGNVKIKSDNFLSDVENSLSYASDNSYGLVKTSSYGGLINENGVLSINVSYIIDNIRTNPESYATPDSDIPGLVSIKTGNGLSIDENGQVSTTYASNTNDIDNLSYGVVRSYIDSFGNTHGIIIDQGVMSVDTEYVLKEIKNSPNSYAGTSIAGMVKIGKNIDYDYDTGEISLTYANSTKAGLVMVGDTDSGIINENGKLSLDTTYITKTIFADGAEAGIDKLGLVKTTYNASTYITSDGVINIKLGENINVDENGYIGIDKASKENYGIVKVGKGLEVDDGIVRCDAIYSDSISALISGSTECFYNTNNMSLSININAGGAYAWNLNKRISEYNISNCIIDETIDNVTTRTTLPYSNSGSLSTTRQYSNITSNVTLKLISYDIDGKTYNSSASKTIIPYDRIWYGSPSLDTTLTVMTASEMLKLTCHSSVKTSISGDYSIPVINGQYIWICIPSCWSINKVKDKATGGMDVAMSEIVGTLTQSDINEANGSILVSQDYKCYRGNATQGVNKTLNITIS